jgi:hypothetical protein
VTALDISEPTRSLSRHHHHHHQLFLVVFHRRHGPRSPPRGMLLCIECSLCVRKSSRNDAPPSSVISRIDSRRSRYPSRSTCTDNPAGMEKTQRYRQQSPSSIQGCAIDAFGTSRIDTFLMTDWLRKQQKDSSLATFRS